MTKKHRMLLTVAVFAGLLVHSTLAQVNPPTPAAPAPQETAPPIIPANDARVIPTPPPPAAQKTATKKTTPAKPAKKTPAPADSAAKSEPPKLMNPEPAVALSKNVNVRGQANINSEIVTHLKRGEVVNVLDEVTLKSPKADEPARWAKIELPIGTPVWVSALFVDKNNKTVSANRLRLRSGPGENYSTVGMLEKGATLKELETKGDWIKIESPAGAYAFVAAHLISRNPADVGPALAKAAPPAPPPTTVPPPATPTQPPPPPATTVVETQPPVVTPVEPADPPTVTPTPATPPASPVLTTTPALTPVPTPAPATDEPLPKRIVTREGIVRGSASIQAPTYFVLRSLDNNRTINYLHSPTTNIVIREFLYQRVIVTGEELLDERWPHVPVVDIETIQTVP